MDALPVGMVPSVPVAGWLARRASAPGPLRTRADGACCYADVPRALHKLAQARRWRMHSTIGLARPRCSGRVALRHARIAPVPPRSHQPRWPGATDSRRQRCACSDAQRSRRIVRVPSRVTLHQVWATDMKPLTCHRISIRGEDGQRLPTREGQHAVTAYSCAAKSCSRATTLLGNRPPKDNNATAVRTWMPTTI